MYYETTENNNLRFTVFLIPYMYKIAVLDLQTRCWEFVFGSFVSVRNSDVI